ncbi:MAG TPA: hypothetical protein PKK70_03370 [Candidatus Paceibacterota bacterium]|nr:hypothetical protein [Candidatus Paceibacterota bacterium]HPS18430.1 glycerol acyltransferase [Bacteroidales bacterium]
MEYINLSELINGSNSKMLKKLPFFCISFLKYIIRQNEINNILNKYSNYEGVDFLPKVIEELNIKIEIEGIENLPENGKCFFVANHPFGFIDGLILTNTIAAKYGDFRAIGNEVFTLIPHVKPIIAAVNVFGTNPKEYLVDLEKLFESDLPITHFPAGVVSRIKKCKVQDSEWQKSFIKKSVSYKRDIVPFYFYGKNSIFFYLTYIIRKTFRINMNFELALLPRELFSKRNKTIKVKIGKPISYYKFDNSISRDYWAKFVRSEVYKLRYI